MKMKNYSDDAVILRDRLKNTDYENEREKVRTTIEDYVFSSRTGCSLEECIEDIDNLNSGFYGKLGALTPYIQNKGLNEIMVNGKDDLFYEEKGQMYYRGNVFQTTEELEEIIRNIAASVHREINELNPILDARLPDGSRVSAIYKNIVTHGPVLTIRKFAGNHITIEQMVEGGTLSAMCADFLKILTECGYNIFVSGGTSSGKTTFLNALSDFIPDNERVIVIEDSTELQIDKIRNLVQMECRNANSMGKGEITMNMLIKASLRMRPDRIIVGEVRGAEIADMINAFNTGHSGSMSTGHGNSVRGMLRRLEAMYLMGAQIPLDAIRGQLTEGIDLMIHLGRFGNGKRKVMEIQELCGYRDGEYILNPLFHLNDKGELVHTGNRLKKRSKLLLKGYEDFEL